MSGCNFGFIIYVFIGVVISNNDGMFCLSVLIVEFNGNDVDNDGLIDNLELVIYMNLFDVCSFLFDVLFCDGILNSGFVIQVFLGKFIVYVEVDFNCDVLDEYFYVFNDNVDNDIDDDGVFNVIDLNLDDFNQVFVQYWLLQNSFGIYGFEDFWLEVGDYDFNDFVVQVKERIIINSFSRVYCVVYDIKIMVMGGIYNNNFGIVMLDFVNNVLVKIIFLYNVIWSSE